MNDSLSIILPVRNAEAHLAEQVADLLDVLPDLTSRFEILIIDDASIDQTPEIATDMARRFPQVRLLRQSGCYGQEAAIKMGLSRALGQTLLVHDSSGPISQTDLRRLWSLRHDRQLVTARSQQPGILDPVLVERLVTWGQTLRSIGRKKLAGGLQMVRRDGAQTISASKPWTMSTSLENKVPVST